MPKRTTLAILALLAAFAQAQAPNPKILERYKQMLSANPVEGIALERLWKAAVDSGSTQELIEEFERRKDFSGRMIAGHLLRRAGRLDEAIKAFAAAAAADEKNPLPGLAMAHLEQERGNPRAAVAGLERAVEKLAENDPRLVDALLELGSAWLAAGERDRGAQAWERLIALAPANLDVRRRLASAYAENFMPEPAIRHYEHLAEHGPVADRAGALQEIAKLHSGAGRPGKALEALERAVSFTAPGNWLRSELLGQMVRIAQRQNAEAALEAKWKAAAEANPRDLGATLRMAEFYEGIGDLEQQIVWLEKICAQLPRAAEYRLKLARALAQRDLLERAAAEYDKLIESQPANVDLAFERARLDVQQERFEAARDRIANLVAQSPRDEGLRGKALQFYRENRFFNLQEEALKADAEAGSQDAILALANFYFSQHRKDDAQLALARLARPEDPPAVRATAHLRAAEALRGQGELVAALEALQAALRLEPQRRDLQVFRGELEMALRRYDEARGAFARAYALSASDAERQEADSKAFETYRAEAAADEAQEGGGRRPRDGMAARVEGYIRELMRAATEAKDAASWLRVARWKAWNSDRASAATFATKAADLEPGNVAPIEFLARLAITNGDAADGLRYLRQLAELNPAKRAEYLREIAQLEMQRGQHGAALEIFGRRVEQNPGDPEALADLAGAQERAGQLQLALETWRKAVAASPVNRQREAGASLLRILQRLGRHQEAAEWLLGEVDGTPDEQERIRRFDELLLHARQHGLLSWLKDIFQERRKRQADDYFTAMALGRVLKLSGNKQQAFELFTDAVFSAPDRAEALPELIREAEDLRRLDVAARLQEQLTRATPQPSADDLLKLAALHFKTGDLEGAEQAWIRVVAKFPRDAEVARRAAEFHQQWGDPDRARVLLRKVVALEPVDARAALDWGELEFRAGRFAEAQPAFEAVMKLTSPVAQRFFPAAMQGSPWGEKGLFAGTARVSRALSEPVLLASGWRAVAGNTAMPPEPGAEMRLRAIARLGEIARRVGGARREQWIGDWNSAMAAQPTDALWALYFAGARSAALREVRAEIRRDPQIEGPRQAFIWMALESQAWPELHEWLNAPGRSEKDLDWFRDAFASFTVNHPAKVSVPMLDAIFPSGRSARAWQCALELGRQQRFAEAAMLAGRVWANLSTQRADLGREIARWHLALGQMEEARRYLREVAFMPGDSLESQPHLALRELLHLLPEDARKRLLQERLAAAGGNTPADVMARFACHVFAEDEKAAREALRALVDQRPMGGPGNDESNSSIRSWSFLMGAHRQLVAWDRPDLALEMWRPIFADPGLLAWWREQKIRQRVEGVPGFADAEHWVNKRVFAADEKRARDWAGLLEFALGGPVEREQIREELRARGASALEKFGDQLEAHSMPAAAAGIFLEAWKADPADPGLLRKTLVAAHHAGDTEMSEEVRRLCLEQRLNPGNDTSPREFALELADLLVRRGALDEAAEVLDRARQRAPEFRILDKSAQIAAWRGKSEEADALWAAAVKSAGGSAQDRSAVAARLEGRGKIAEALAARSAGSPNGDAQVPVLLYKLGRAEDAVLALEKMLGEHAVYTAMMLAEHMGLRGEGKLARSVLLATASRVQQPRAQMQLRAKLLTIPGVPPSAGLIQRTQVKLRALATQNRELAEPYYEFFHSYADRFGFGEAWNAELLSAWASGEGALAAGVALARRHASAGKIEAARAVLEQIAVRADADAVTLERVDSIAAAAKLPEIRLRVAEINARRGWPYAEPTFRWIRLLDALGKGEEARKALEGMGWLTAFSGGGELLGQAWLDLGDPERARRFLQRALQQDVLLDNPSELAAMARVQIAAKRLPAARLLLRRAFAMPSCRQHAALVDYLAATNNLGRWKEVAREFELPPASEYELALAVFAHFERLGQFTDALALIAQYPRLVVPAGAPGELAPAEAVTCARLRAWARRTGGFAETAKVLDLLVATGLAGAAAERAALDADRAAAANEPALPHLARAAELNPGAWEHARPLAEAQLGAGQKAAAKTGLERFLFLANKPLEREAALTLWEKAGG